jgi:hypothetical protein
MRPFLRYFPVVEDNDLVGFPHAAETVGDEDDGLSLLAIGAYGVLNVLF